jgi:hypothetical protein
MNFYGTSVMCALKSVLNTKDEHSRHEIFVCVVTNTPDFNLHSVVTNTPGFNLHSVVTN